MNNIDFAEAMIECVEQVLNKTPPIQPLTWESLLLALQEYIVTEEYEIQKKRREGK